ncbi:alpha/beta-hydrolase [Thozetella sp. PMI_491]|nr:alpha/beta-hydrolase [Thozetella sp. PMI_491]
MSVRKAYADTPLGQVHYRHIAAAAGVPKKDGAVLFLHMSASDSASGHKLMTHFAAKGYATFAPDMPGFGGSFDPALDPPAISWYVDLYYDIFSKLPECSGGVHLIGHHSGGAIGTEFAVLKPDFVKSLTIVGPVAMSAEERAEFSKTTMVAFNEPVPDGSHLLKTWNYLTRQGAIPVPTGSEDPTLGLLHRESIAHIRAWKGRLQIYNCVWQHDGLLLLPQVKCPVLALCAKDDVLYPLFHYVTEVRPQTETVLITGANFGPDRGAESIIEAMTPFLEKI